MISAETQIIRNRLPSVEEACAAVKKPLCESYWWFTGWDFNRPVIAVVNVGAHVEKGPYVQLEVGDHHSRFRDGELDGINFELRGPIELPEDLRK